MIKDILYAVRLKSNEEYVCRTFINGRMTIKKYFNAIDFHGLNFGDRVVCFYWSGVKLK